MTMAVGSIETSVVGLLLAREEAASAAVVDGLLGARERAACWYLLRVHPGREFHVIRALSRPWRHVAAYLPVFKKQMRVNARITRLVDRPLFPGLVFIPDFEAHLDWRGDVDGVSSFLRFGEVPATLSPALLDDVIRLEAILALPRSKRDRAFTCGDLVRINEGPFAGWTGRIDRLDQHGRISVLIDAIKRGLPVNISESQVEPV